MRDHVVAGPVPFRPGDRRFLSPSPAKVQEVLSDPGLPLGDAVRAQAERRFGFDFAGVRVHSDMRAAESAESIGALAYTVGHHIVYGAGRYDPFTEIGGRLLTHELAHVVQQAGEPLTDSLPAQAGSASDVEADASRTVDDVAADRRARPTLRVPVGTYCKTHEQGKVRDGEYTFDMDLDDGNTRVQKVVIEFMPDRAGPQTDHIEFIQVASVMPFGGGPPQRWGGKLHKGEDAIDEMLTPHESRVHETHQGDTLASLSTTHYGVADRAAEIYQANRALGISASPTALLRAGQFLTVPGAVAGGAHVDISTAGKVPRALGDPNISPNYENLLPREYPPETKEFTPGGLRQDQRKKEKSIGHNSGGRHDSAKMVDRPGGGYIRSHYRFETLAHADDLGLSYGAVQWGFDYNPLPAGSLPSITNEYARITPNASDTVGAAIVAFNRYFHNKHVVQQGETLRSICLAYFRDSTVAYALFSLNVGVLPTFDPDAPLPVGRELILPGSATWSKARLGTSGVESTPAERAAAALPSVPVRPGLQGLGWPQ